MKQPSNRVAFLKKDLLKGFDDNNLIFNELKKYFKYQCNFLKIWVLPHLSLEENSGHEAFL